MSEQIIKAAKALCEKFIDKVETGRARSRETYAECKALLKIINENEQEVIDKAFGKGTATEVKICGRIVRLGDKLKVRYTTGERFKGATIEGTVIELWSNELNDHLQGRLSNQWCFHDYDEILSHNDMEIEQ